MLDAFPSGESLTAKWQGFILNIDPFDVKFIVFLSTRIAFFLLPANLPLKGPGNQGGSREVYYKGINPVENLVGSNRSFLEKAKLH